jgi:hypothetical protein
VVLAVRYGVPAALVVAGVILLLIGGSGPTGVGVVLLGGAVIVFGLNSFLRWSIAEQADRDREEAAREHFRAHGRWPGE